MLNITSSKIAISLIVSVCDGPTPTYQVHSRALTSGTITVARQLNSTVYELSSLTAATAYDVQLVDTECPNIILQRLPVMTEMDPSELLWIAVYFWYNLHPSCTLLIKLVGYSKLINFTVFRGHE